MKNTTIAEAISLLPGIGNLDERALASLEYFVKRSIRIQLSDTSMRWVPRESHFGVTGGWVRRYELSAFRDRDLHWKASLEPVTRIEKRFLLIRLNRQRPLLVRHLFD